MHTSAVSAHDQQSSQLTSTINVGKIEMPSIADLTNSTFYFVLS